MSVGLSLEMWDEFALPGEGGICNNFDERMIMITKRAKKNNYEITF